MAIFLPLIPITIVGLYYKYTKGPLTRVATYLEDIVKPQPLKKTPTGLHVNTPSLSPYDSVLYELTHNRPALKEVSSPTPLGGRSPSVNLENLAHSGISGSIVPIFECSNDRDLLFEPTYRRPLKQAGPPKKFIKNRIQKNKSSV